MAAMSDTDAEQNKILVAIVDKLAELRGIEIDTVFEQDGLADLITEALCMSEGEVSMRPSERLAIGLLIDRWRALEGCHAARLVMRID